jgi:hypothetical protein
MKAKREKKNIFTKEPRSSPILKFGSKIESSSQEPSNQESFHQHMFHQKAGQEAEA